MYACIPSFGRHCQTLSLGGASVNTPACLSAFRMRRDDVGNHEAYTVESHCYSKLHLRDRDTICPAILFSFLLIYATSTGSIHTRTRTHTQHIYNGILPVHYFLLFIELYDQNSKQFLSPEYFIRPLLFFTLKLLNYIIFKNSCHGQFVLSVP